MADRPRDDTWWIASDGKWYPPTLESDPDAEPAVGMEQATSAGTPSVVSGLMTRVLTTTLVATSAAFVVAAIFGLQYGSALRSASLSAADQASAEALFLGWSSFALVAMMATGAIVLVWAFRTSRAFDGRGASGRRWRGGWTIGSWFVPLASFVLPRLVFIELEKISRVPFDGSDIGERWKAESRSVLGDVWWLLWVVGLFMYQSSQVLLTDPGAEVGTVAVATTLSGAAHLVLAAAGFTLVVVVRRIDSRSRL